MYAGSWEKQSGGQAPGLGVEMSRVTGAWVSVSTACDFPLHRTGKGQAWRLDPVCHTV